jgi:6-phosphogluconolactonase
MHETSAGETGTVIARAADWLEEKLCAALEADGQRRVVLAVPGGRSVTQVLGLLFRADLDWMRVRIALTDERHLPHGDPDRNDRLIEELYATARRDEPGERLLRPPFHAGNPERAAAEYTEMLQNSGGRLSVVLLGAGEDGHIASLFPGRRELGMIEPVFAAVRGAPKPPPERITMLPPLITGADHSCLLFLGAGKAGAYRAFADPKVATTACPAKLLLAMPSLHVAVDDDAGGG